MTSEHHEAVQRYIRRIIASYESSNAPTPAMTSINRVNTQTAVESSEIKDSLLNQGKSLTCDGPAPYIGNILDNPDLIWTEDVWTDERFQEATQKILRQGDKLSEFWLNTYSNKAERYWYNFYKRNESNFYKDRHYLHVVFPELATPCTLLEVGCGVGNAVLPLIDVNPDILIVAIDFAATAIELLNRNPDIYTYPEVNASGSTDSVDINRVRVQRIFPFQCDIVNEDIPSSSELTEALHAIKSWNDSRRNDVHSLSRHDRISHSGDISECKSREISGITTDNQLLIDNAESLSLSRISVADGFDNILCLFVLSAINPKHHRLVLSKLMTRLKPNGKLLLRDYGRFDEAQLRFNKGSKLDDNFYVRQDGTCAYYFDKDELENMICSLTNDSDSTDDDYNSRYEMVAEENYYIRRQYANRQQKSARHRVWIHAKFIKRLKL